MRRLMALCLIALGVIASQISVSAQNPEPPRGSFPNIDSVPIPARPGSDSPRYSPKREDKVIRKGILAPLESDLTAHKALLSMGKTGLIRLLPRESYDWRTYRVPKRVELRGGGAYFSFHFRTHEYNFGSDLEFDKGLLSVGFAGADYGMMTDLGDTPLEPIVAEDPRATFLLNYKPPRKEYDARIEARKFYPAFGCDGVTGFTFDGVEYFKTLPAILNHTYLLRSIDYQISDLLVAFRVVRMSEDGILTIAWKILKQFSAPKLIRDDIKVPGTVIIIGPCRRP